MSRGARDIASACIMLVDDEPTTLDVMEMFLRDAGCRRLVKTTDASEVLDLLASERPDLLLLNLMMPKRNGIQILKSMAGDPELADIPVIIVSSSSDPATKHGALEHGATDFLCKPVDASELEMRVRNTLASRAVAAASESSDVADVGDPLVSRLDDDDPRSRAILATFVGRLEAKLLAMEASLEARDFAELVALAHWLKGAAGTVGFDAFTGPAETLRLLAQEAKEPEIESSLRELRGLARRIVVRGGSGG